LEQSVTGCEDNFKWLCCELYDQVNTTEQNREDVLQRNSFTWLVYSGTFGLNTKTPDKKSFYLGMSFEWQRQVKHLLSENPKSSMQQNWKCFENLHNTTKENSTCGFLWHATVIIRVNGGTGARPLGATPSTAKKNTNQNN
jgi:hypothetical protein